MINLYKLLFYVPFLGLLMAIFETGDFDYHFFRHPDSYYDFLTYLIIQHLSMFGLAVFIAKYT